MNVYTKVNDLIFVDDAHTFGGAQIALAHAIRAVLDHSDLEVTYIGTAKTKSLVESILGGSPQLRFIECPPALPLNLFTFPVRLLSTSRLIESLMQSHGFSNWILNLSGIEFCLASLVCLRLRGKKPVCWLHNPEPLSSFTSRSHFLTRLLSSLRDTLANQIVFRQYRRILTPSKETAEFVSKRANLAPHTATALYPTITGIPNEPTENRLPASGAIDLWMIGRIDYGHKNNEIALLTLKELRDQCVPCTLTVVGDGPDCGSFLAKAEELNLRSSINFLGWQQNPWNALPPAAIVIIPSHWEANCLVAIEALLRNMRLVLSPIAAFREVYPPAVIAEVSSTAALSDTVKRVSRLTDQQISVLYRKAIECYLPANFSRNLLSSMKNYG